MILFNFPQVGFFILLLIPFLLGQFALALYRQKQLAAYAQSDLLSRLIIPRSSILRYTKIIGWMLIWILICLASMDPFGNIRYSSLPVHQTPASVQSSIAQEIILLVDTSASMRVPDGPDGQTRLETAKIIMQEILHQLHGQTISLYAFTSVLSSIVPPTLDYLFTRLSINDLQINQGDIGGTRFAPVLADLKKQAFPESSYKHYTVIMLTDGGDTQLEKLKGEARDEEIQVILNAIPNPQQLHVHLLTIGLGTLQPQLIPQVTWEGKPVLSKLEPEILQQLAAHARGKYYMAEEWTSWNLAQEVIRQIEAYERLDSEELLTERKVMAITQEDIIVDLYYQIPLGLALLFYAINLLLPDVRCL